LYFSASWCGPCRKFTPQLESTYKSLKAENAPFEVVFVSADKDESSYTSYFAKMPWLSVPFNDKTTKDILMKEFEIDGYPTLVVVKGNQIVNGDAVSDVMSGQKYIWTVPRVVTLEGGAKHLNTQVCVVALMDKETQQTQTQIQSEFTKLSEEKGNESYFFLHATETTDLLTKVKTFVGVNVSPALIILNLGEGQKFIHTEEFKADAVRTFISKFQKKELTPFMKSQPRPQNDADPQHPGIKIVVANSFDEIVLDKTKLVFLDVYADWCGPCQAIKPEIMRMGEVIHEMKVKDIVIAKLDCHVNDTDKKYIPESSIPNLKLFVKGNPIKYTGQRNASSMLSFIHEHAKSNGISFDLDAALKTESKKSKQ